MLQLSKNDECYTQREAIEFLLPFIPSGKIIWESTDFGGSIITKVLKENGFNVFSSHLKYGQDYLKAKSNNIKKTITITNPPFSKKTDFLKKAFESGEEFMFLLPLTALEGKARSELFRKYEFSVLIPNKRFEFDYEGKGDKKQNRFCTVWIGNMIPGRQILFKEVKKN